MSDRRSLVLGLGIKSGVYARSLTTFGQGRGISALLFRVCLGNRRLSTDLITLNLRVFVQEVVNRKETSTNLALDLLTLNFHDYAS